MLHKISLFNFPEVEGLSGNKKIEAGLEIQKTEIEFQVKNYCTNDNESLINIIRQNLKLRKPLTLITRVMDCVNGLWQAME